MINAVSDGPAGRSNTGVKMISHTGALQSQERIEAWTLWYGVSQCTKSYL